MVETVFTAQLTVPTPTLSATALSSLESSLAGQVASGQVGGDQASIQQALVKAIDASPLTYLIPTHDLQSTVVRTAEMGSGLVVSAEGDLLTSSVVVKPPEASVKAAFARQGLVDLARQDASELASAQSGGLSGSALSLLEDAASQYNAHYVKVGPITSSTTAQWGPATSSLVQGRQGVPVTIMALQPELATAHGSLPGLALLHADSMKGMPNAFVDVSTEHEGSPSKVSEIGYPAVSAFSDGQARISYETPVATSSKALRGSWPSTPVTTPVTTSAGASTSSQVHRHATSRARAHSRQVLTVSSTLDAAASGGVLVDSDGAIVGMVAAPGTGPFSPTDPATSVAIPGAQISAFLVDNHVPIGLDRAGRLYQDAFDQWFARHYSSALPDFEQIMTVAPQDLYAKAYATAARRLIAAGMDRTPISIWTELLIALLSLAGLRLVVFPLIRYTRRGHHARREARWIAGESRADREERAFPVADLRPNEEEWAEALKDSEGEVAAHADQSAGVTVSVAAADGGEEVDGGDRADGGESSSGGDRADGGEEVDGGDRADGGESSSGGDRADGGEEVDGGDRADGGEEVDGGDRADGGEEVDGGDRADGGESSSGGDRADGGEEVKGVEPDGADLPKTNRVPS